MSIREEFLLAIYDHQPLKQLRALILRNPSVTLEEDEAGLDCLHHAILANNMEAVYLLLAQTIFQESRRPGVPYIHLACRYGRLAALNLLMRERPADMSLALSLDSGAFYRFTKACEVKPSLGAKVSQSGTGDSRNESSTQVSNNDVIFTGITADVQVESPVATKPDQSFENVLYVQNAVRGTSSSNSDTSLQDHGAEGSSLSHSSDEVVLNIDCISLAVERSQQRLHNSDELDVPIRSHISSPQETEPNSSRLDDPHSPSYMRDSDAHTGITVDLHTEIRSHEPNDSLQTTSPCTKADPPERWSALIAACPDLAYKGVRALDVAACCGHVRCVRRLLEGEGRKGLLESAVTFSSSVALGLLLKNTVRDNNADDMALALKAALTRKLWRCVDLLLDYGASYVDVLHGLNPYHVMYMYSSGFQMHGPERRHAGLAETTAVLLRHGVPAGSCRPSGSYPLYSLLHAFIQEKDFHPAKVPIHHISALRLLLAAGVDPNFDETEVSDQFDSERYLLCLTVGRELYTSALNALFVAVQQSDQWDGWQPQGLVHVVQLLISHGARVNHVDTFGDTPLHDLMKCLAMQHAIGNFCLDLRPVLVVLLQHGADPGLPSSNGISPPHFYFAILFHLISGLTAMDHWRHHQCANQVIWLMRFVDFPAMLRISAQIRLVCARLEKELPTHLRSYIEEELAEVTSQPRALLTLCRLQLWLMCQRDHKRLQAVPIPKILKDGVLDLFDI